MELKKKTEEELEKLNAPRLLAYYKAERHRAIRFVAANTCECCGEKEWDLHSNRKDESAKEKEWEEYLKTIKSVLDTKEHVKDK